MPTLPHVLAPTLGVDLSGYLPIGVLLLMAITFAAVNLVATLVIGPGRDGGTKTQTYESGMVPIGTARKRFNVRFYIIAVTFLVFDVEVIFLFPWAVTFANLSPGSPESAVFLGRVFFFMFTTIVAYIYAYRKGIFRFD